MKEKRKKQNNGFRNIKMEDGLRCDPCSCFYLDRDDYLKHIRKPHQSGKIQHSKQRKQRKRRGGCKNCCQVCDCTGIHVSKELINNKTEEKKNLQGKIQSRWDEISQRLKNDTQTKIKSEPEDEKCDNFLLSNVDVKIKLEVKEENSD